MIYIYEYICDIYMYIGHCDKICTQKMGAAVDEEVRESFMKRLLEE